MKINGDPTPSMTRKRVIQDITCSRVVLFDNPTRE